MQPYPTIRCRRLAALGIQVKEIYDEEWSFIPIGGPVPVAQNRLIAFGAAANFVHPATGYSVTRSMQQADAFAEILAAKLKETPNVSGVDLGVWIEERR